MTISTTDPSAGAEHEAHAGEAIGFDDVTVHVWDTRAKRRKLLLSNIDWRVRRGEHWGVIGPNGAGKTTVLGTIMGRRRPTSGTVCVLGHPIGTPQMRDPRGHVGFVEATPRAFSQNLSPVDVVLNGATGSVASQGRRITPQERERAVDLLILLGCEDLLDRRYTDCSQGERQRVLLGRALMRRPPLLLLDEPTTGLDLPARDALLNAMPRLAEEDPELATVTVTHHVEELAPSTTHILLLAEGRVVAAGPLEETLTEEWLTRAFGVELALSQVGNRWFARIP